jgi:hypothetical protein
MTPGDGADPADADGAGTGPSPDDGRAETYIRLRAEAELRRALSLPRYEPSVVDHRPGPVRFAARLARPAVSAVAGAAGPVLPLAQRAADTLRPAADSAVRTVQPLADRAARGLRPVADDAARRVRPIVDDAAGRLRPLADNAQRTLQPVADLAARTVLPTAGEAVRRAQPLAEQAAGHLQMLRYTAPHVLRQWRWRVARAERILRHASPTAAPERDEPSAEDGVHRLMTVAHALARVGAIERGTADAILSGLETALVARSRMDPHELAMRELHAGHGQPPAHAPAGQYLAVPVGATVSATPDSSLGDVQLFAFVIAPDRASLTVAGRMPVPGGRRRPHMGPWDDLPDLSGVRVTDDRGSSYQVDYGSSQRDGEGQWSAVLTVSPIPPAGTQWLELAIGPGPAAIRVDLTSPAGGDRAAPGSPQAASPAERLVDAAAENLLQAAAGHRGGTPWHDLSDIADIVTALGAVGALQPALDAVGRLIALAGRLDVEVPPALSAATPVREAELPASWESLLENRGREDGRRGVAAAAAVLPELDGVRVALAGLRSHAAGAELQALAWGWRHMPGFFAPVPDDEWSWSARDDKGRWHVVSEGSGSYGGDYGEMELLLAPALHPDATSLEMTLAGPSGQVSVTVPLNWWEAR